MQKLDLPRIVVAGTPTQMGEAHGRQLRNQIQDFVAMRLQAALVWGASVSPTPGAVTIAALIDAGRGCLHAYQTWDPDGFAEHAGIANGAGVGVDELYTAANMTDVRDVVVFGTGHPKNPHHGLRADAEGCSAVLVPAQLTRSGAAIAAQTWDLNPQDLDYVVAIHRQPVRGPQTWSVTCTGCLSLVGMNETGLAVGTTNVKTAGSRSGIGYMGILHKMLNSNGFAAAAQICTTAPRAAAHTYWLADRDHLAEWETTPTTAVRRDAGSAALLRTNHCLVAEHSAIEGEPPTASSLARLGRLGQRIAERTDHDLGTMQALFADRSDGVDSISRLAEDAQGTTTNSVVVCIPQQREIWACRGPADQGHWQQLAFATGE
ncbi:MAG: hypothetical protein EXR77_09140 [Myxococcales bacterium]|nr:hypothetical protein [Myxococcales bacterium]